MEAEKNVAYPLNDVAIQDLKDLQRLLSLRDEDVKSVKQQVLGDCLRAIAHTPQHAIHQKTSQKIGQKAGQKTSQNHIPHNHPSSQPRPALPLNPRLIQTANISAAQTPSNKPPTGHTHPSASLPSPPFQSIAFQTVRVNAYGKVIEQRQGTGITFTEMLGHGIELTMVKIPSGTFTMGAAPGEPEANENEYPPRNYTLPEFWMSQHAITQAQWSAVMETPSTAQASRGEQASPEKSNHPLTSSNAQRPVDHVFWTDAVAFCHALSQKTHRDYRLPSGAQWEYDCRAGTTAPFHFGATLTPELANYNGNYSYSRGPKGQYRGHTTEVGSFLPNDFGLYDMHGNVWEWCLDGWQRFEPNSSAQSSIQRLSGQKKSLKGGSWFYLPASCRSAHRLTYPFHNRTDDIGFRVICMLQQVSET